MTDIKAREDTRSTEQAQAPAPHRRRRALLSVAVVLVIAIVGFLAAAAFSGAGSGQGHPGTWNKLTWRVRLFTRKAEGGIPYLSWKELWQMARHRGGFGLNAVADGLSLDEGITNPYITKSDYDAGSQLFRTRCAVCHGNDAAGGRIGPALNRIPLAHGDSDFAIYKTIRDGIPGTPMRAPTLSMVERWQLVGYIKYLQTHDTGSTATAPQINIDVSSPQILAAGSHTDEWLTYSGSLDGHRYSSLAQINTGNVRNLRLLWARQFDTSLPSIEATPIVAGGTIFTTEPPSDTIAVDAIDAGSGDLIWRYARAVPSTARACCGRFNRGVAVLGNRVFLASMEGYLICLDANTGNLVWKTQVVDPSQGYSLSAAPLIVDRSVVIGVAGAEYTIRGFIAAYDPDTGQKQWQFNTIPGPGEAGHNSWNGDSWKYGGGSTWVTGSYDPALKLLYWGVGNPAPAFSGADRVGDNLYTDSVVALHADTGKLAWYFQFTPHDTHDWDSAQTPILADLSIDGRKRKVICWANRNGFYYVLDRVTGAFLTGVPFVEENWATGLDPAGRPILAKSAEGSGGWKTVKPASGGGTDFQNASFDPQSKLIFVPATEGTGMDRRSLRASPELGELFLGSGGAFVSPTPVIPVIRALDAATGKRKWQYFPPVHLQNPTAAGTLSYGGLLSTGGGLVFGASGGYFFAIDATTGHELWRTFLGGDTRAAPISFTVGGKQVVALSAGRALFVFGL